MNMFIIGIIIINVICVGITDMTDAMIAMKKLLIYVLSRGKVCTANYSFKLLECSLCLVFHLSNIWLIVYCIFIGLFNMWFMLAPILSALLTPQVYSILIFLQDCISTLINIMNRLLKLINKG